MTKNTPASYQPRFEWQFLTPTYWPTWVALALLRMILLIPASWVDAIGSMVGSMQYRLNDKRRKIVLTNLQMAFPEISERARTELAKQHFVASVRSLLDMAVLWWGSDRRLDAFVNIVGLEHYEKALSQKKNIILLTGHFVGLEFGGTMMSKHHPHIGLIKPERNRLVDWFIVKGRTRYGARLYRRDDGMRQVVKAIRDGHGFYYLPDEDHGPEKSVFVNFFATRASMLKGVAKLVKLCDAAALPAYIRRIDSRHGYELVIRPALDNFPSADEQRDAQMVASALEQSIRACPEQYMWTYRIFHSRPGGGKSPYDRPRDRRRQKTMQDAG